MEEFWYGFDLQFYSKLFYSNFKSNFTATSINNNFTANLKQMKKAFTANLKQLRM